MSVKQGGKEEEEERERSVSGGSREERRASKWEALTVKSNAQWMMDGGEQASKQASRAERTERTGQRAKGKGQRAESRAERSGAECRVAQAGDYRQGTGTGAGPGSMDWKCPVRSLRASLAWQGNLNALSCLTGGRGRG